MKGERECKFNSWFRITPFHFTSFQSLLSHPLLLKLIFLSFPLLLLRCMPLIPFTMQQPFLFVSIVVIHWPQVHTPLSHCYFWRLVPEAKRLYTETGKVAYLELSFPFISLPILERVFCVSICDDGPQKEGRET